MKLTAVDTGLWLRITEHVVAHGGNLIRPWFAQLDPIAMEHGLLEIQAPGETERQYLQQHAMRLFTDAAQAATGRLVGVCFLAEDNSQKPPASDADKASPGQTGFEDTPPINGDYTFESLVAGPCNRLAHAACLAVCESPGRTYNPLFIHGDVGLGKTHLLHALCHALAHRGDGFRYCMLSCETFVNHFIGAVERGDLHNFRYRYRHADVLVIDDVQFLAGREQTQEEFFHTFNALYQTQKQIVLSCDRSPAEIPHLEDRLVSRFSWGLVARVDKPAYETRVAIIRKKAKLRNLALPEDVICRIAGAIDSNPRELEGALAKVAMLAKVYDRPIDMAICIEAFGAEEAPQQPEITVERILDAVTGRFNVRLADLQSKKRTKSIVYPRQVCMYLARSLTRHSLEEIGGYFGGRDHTTVLHANRTIQNLRDNDGQVNALLEHMTRELQRSL
ncbi:MAG: chromosomal replication initiator protein DnaA [Planctomycetes bacterium]|nr:chromosomal replication initiator protein DnaA [Planctomycetota bacterium]